MKTLYIDMHSVLVGFPSETAACGSALLEGVHFGHEQFYSWAEVVAYLREHAAPSELGA
jgi:hypothetical protein